MHRRELPRVVAEECGGGGGVVSSKVRCCFLYVKRSVEAERGANNGVVSAEMRRGWRCWLCGLRRRATEQVRWLGTLRPWLRDPLLW